MGNSGGTPYFSILKKPCFLRTFCGKLRTFCGKVRTFCGKPLTESPINKGFEALPENPLIIIRILRLIIDRKKALTPSTGLSLFFSIRQRERRSTGSNMSEYRYIQDLLQRGAYLSFTDRIRRYIIGYRYRTPPDPEPPLPHQRAQIFARFPLSTPLSYPTITGTGLRT